MYFIVVYTQIIYISKTKFWKQILKQMIPQNLILATFRPVLDYVPLNCIYKNPAGILHLLK